MLSRLGLKNIQTVPLQRGKNHQNEDPGYYTKQSNSEIPVMLELWGMWSARSLPSLPGPFWPGMVTPDRVLSIGLIELKFVLVLNRTAWNRTVLTCKLRTYAKLNCLKSNCFCMLKWIIWNRTILTCKQKLYLYSNELFELELFN